MSVIISEPTSTQLFRLVFGIPTDQPREGD